MKLHELHDVTKEKEISNLLVLLPPEQAERSDLTQGYRLNAMRHMLSASCLEGGCESSSPNAQFETLRGKFPWTLKWATLTDFNLVTLLLSWEYAMSIFLSH